MEYNMLLFQCPVLVGMKGKYTHKGASEGRRSVR